MAVLLASAANTLSESETCWYNQLPDHSYDGQKLW